MKKIITTIILMMAISMFWISSATAGETIFEKTVSDDGAYGKFISALQKAKLLSPEGNIATKGLCTAAWEVATTKKLFAAGEIGPNSYCQAFLNYNYVGYLLKDGSISEQAFRSHPGGWKLPTLAEISVIKISVPEVKASAAAVVTPVKQVQPASVPVVSKTSNNISELEKKFAKLQSKVGDNKQLASDLQKTELVITEMKKNMTKLQEKNFSPEQKLFILQLMDEKVLKLKDFHDSILSRLDTVEVKVTAVETKVSVLNQKFETLTQRLNIHEDQIQAGLPVGYQTLENLFGAEVANNAKYLLFALFGILTSIVLLVYPFVFATRSNLNKVKTTAEEAHKKVKVAVETAIEAKTVATDAEGIAIEADEKAKKAAEKVSEISARVDGMMDYTFDCKLVKKCALENRIPNIGDSFPVQLESSDGDDIVLEIMRSKANEITIIGALRQQGNKTPLSCGLDSAVVKINRAIRDGRIEKPAKLKIAV
ncbi:MAG: hypothetical protein RLZZ230_329 [Candidatus Parcubacteria bacterium]|jgi:TolA-binding protein